MTKIIFLELNEVPNKIFIESFSKHNYKNSLKDFDFHQTISKDRGHLSPWTTWATLHRGITDKIHGITDINQDVRKLDASYPTIMSSLADRGLKVGVFGSMHSASVPKDSYSKYCFFVPEPFAIDNHCNPKSINDLQRLNLILSKQSARTISSKMPKIKLTLKAILSYLKHCYKLNGGISAIKQLIIEIFSPWKKVRRRNIQPLILFDVFMDLLHKNNPDFSNFFTNHVASNMHRFWEAKFPKDYSSQISSDKWIKRYKNEIDNAMKETSYLVNELINYVDKQKDYQLWILSSMGQSAVDGYSKQKSFWHIININSFFSSICESNVELEELTQMIPCYSIKSDRETINFICDKLNSIETNVEIKLRSKTDKSMAFEFHSSDLDSVWFKKKGSSSYLNILGLKKIDIGEETGSSAYHIPDGILYRYGSNVKKIEKSYLDENDKLPTNKIKSIVEKTLLSQ